MKSLIQITATLFNNFSIRKYGKPARWIKLSKERQTEWVQDSYVMIEELLDTIEKEVNLIPLNRTYSASYEQGYHKGCEDEKQRIRTKLKLIKDNYLDQFKDFIED